MRANCCSWKCFATGLLIGTLLFITIAMIGGLVAIPVIYVHCPKDYDQYSVVYAAEPYYANVYLYRWDSRNTATLDQPYYTCHIPDTDTDGINTTLARLNHCLHLLVCSSGNSNQQCMPGWSKASLAMYFIATRELYSLHNSNGDNEDLVKQIASTLYEFFDHRNATYLSLNEPTESVATWITANTKYLQHPNQYPSTSMNGVLYLGVASVQLSHMMTGSHSTHLSLYGRNYSIYSDTRWCSGVDELWKIIAVNNTKGNHGDNTINNPCLPQNYQWNVSGSELSSPCTDTSTEGMQFTFQAKDGDTYHQCEQQIDSLISQVTSHASGDYIAFGQFIEIMNFFDTTTLNSSTGWGTYNDTLDKFCQSNWTSLKAVYKEVDDDQLSRRCYDGLLVRLLLMKAYGFTEGKHWSIDFSQINGTNGSTWSLGFMMEQTQQLQSTGPHNCKKRPYSLTSLILSLVELVILLVLFSLFLISVIHVSCSDRNKGGYIAIS